MAFSSICPILMSDLHNILVSKVHRTDYIVQTTVYFTIHCPTILAQSNVVTKQIPIGQSKWDILYVQRWEFIKEKKKVIKRENKNSTKKVTKKKGKNFLFFLITFLVKFLFS